MAWTKLATIAELSPGSLAEVEHEGAYYAVCNVGGEVRALAGTCPHQGGPLGEGALNGDLISCPWHMWEFDTRTGICVFNERTAIPVYPVRLEGEDIMVDLA